MKEKSDILLLIPHYNNFEGLLKSLKSIDEEQTIDVLIVDDGSIKNVIKKDKLEEEKKRNNLIYIFLDKNQGIENALNEGIDFFRANKEYKFLARLDCGDLCAKNRFKIQKEFLNIHDRVGIVGSNIKFFNLKKDYVFNLRLPQKNRRIKKMMYLNAMFIHPSIMLRREVFEKVNGYPLNYPAAEDYAFFFDILKHFEGANINQYLVECELNPNGISIQRRKDQLKSRLRLIYENFYFGFYPLYGFIRNILLYVLPYKLISFLKTIIK